MSLGCQESRMNRLVFKPKLEFQSQTMTETAVLKIFTISFISFFLLKVLNEAYYIVMAKDLINVSSLYHCIEDGIIDKKYMFGSFGRHSAFL